MKIKKKLLSTLSIICAFAIIFGGVFAFFSDSASLSENTKVGTVDIDVEGGLIHSNTLNNLNPGDNDPDVPEDYRSGTDHELSFKIDNLGNKSAIYRTVIEVSAIKSNSTPFTTEELMAIILSEKQDVSTITTQNNITSTDIDKYNTVNRLDATGYDNNKLVYIIGGITENGMTYVLNGTGEDAETEINVTTSSTVQTFDVGLDKDLASDAFEGATITFNVIVQAMQYRNTGDEEWNNIFEQTYTINGTPETTNPEFEQDPIAFAVYSADDGSLTFYNQYPIAEQGKQYKGKTATTIFTGFDTKTYSTTYTDSYNKQYGPPWYSIRNNIKTVHIADKISPANTQSWFFGMTNCMEMDLSKLDTSKVKSMAKMFNDCSKLTKLDLFNFNTSNVTNMAEMFRGCYSITNLNIKSFDTSKVTSTRLMFYTCGALEELDVSGFKTDNVVNMASMFSGCYSLEEIDVSNFNTQKVTTMEAMFQSCKKIKTLNVSNWDTSKVTTFYCMFGSCNELTTLNVSKWNTQNVTNISGMFQYINNLKTLDLSNWKTNKVIDMTYFINNCPLLTSIGDVSNWNTSKVTDMYGAFYSAPKLVVDCRKWNTSSVTDHGVFNSGSPNVTAPTW